MNTYDREPIEIEGYILTHTDKAILVVDDLDEEEMTMSKWIPKRFIFEIEELDLNDNETVQTIEIPTWLAYNEGLI